MQTSKRNYDSSRHVTICPLIKALLPKIRRQEGGMGMGSKERMPNVAGRGRGHHPDRLDKY